MLRRYCLHSLPEFFLCSLTGVTLCVNMLEGFDLPEALYFDYIRIAVITLLFTAVLYAVCYSRRTMLIGSAGLVAAAAAAAMICFANGIPLTETADAEDNAGLWYIIVLTVSLLTFLLTRTVAGCVVLCVLGALANAWIQLSLYQNSVVCLILFLFSSVSLFVLRRYNRNILRMSTHRNATASMFGVSAVAAAASVLCAVLVWFVVISALNPPVMDIKLINRIVSIEVLETIGVSKKQVLTDQDLLSGQIDEDYLVGSSDMNDESDDRDLTAADESYNGDQDDESSGSPNEQNLFQRIGRTLSVIPDFLRSIDQRAVFGGLLALILLLAAAVVYYCTRHRRWLWRLRRRCDMDHQVEAIYKRMVKKMPVVGITRIGCNTPLEYAQQIETQTIVLDQSGITWKELSIIFSRLCYGHQSVSEEEYSGFVSFYNNFCKSARKLCGFRYLWKQFQL